MLASVSDSLNQFAIYTSSSVIATGVGALVVMVTRRHKKLVDKVDDSAAKMDKMYVAFVGEEKTPLNPNPAPGLSQRLDTLATSVATVMVDHSARMKIGDKMVAEFETWKLAQKALEAKVDTIAAHVAEIGKDSKTLVADTKTNGGSSSRDVLNRIEANTKSSKDTVDTISGVPETVTLPDLADTLNRIDDNTKPEEKK